MAVSLLVLSTAPALATDADEVDAGSTAIEMVVDQRVEAPEVGLSIAFPQDWRVSLPAGVRESEIRTPEGDPI